MYTVDHEKSCVAFSVQHLKISVVKGEFRGFSGSITAGDSTSFESCVVEALIYTDSIDTKLSERDRHLKKLLFDTKNFPVMKFTSTKIEQLEDKNKFKVTGDFLIKSISRELTLDCELLGRFGARNLTLILTGEIDRSDWFLDFDTGKKDTLILNNDIFYVGDRISLSILISAVSSHDG